MSKPTSALDLGRVISGHGRHYVVETPEGTRIIAHPRGKKSEAVVGDQVRWMPSGDEAVIEAIEPRTNLLYRQDEWRTKSFAANLDQLLVWVAVEPVFSESQLTRALIAASAADIPALVVLNKTDLPGASEARARLAPYRAMGCEVLELSLKHRPQDAQDTLHAILDGRTTLVLGPSGAGKSTLINHFVPSASAQVAEISTALNSGRHTTTHTQWYWLDSERRGALIDSPGFQEFGLRHIPVSDLSRHMPDIWAHANACRFYNCTHRTEPGCSVRAAADSGDISARRYQLYVELYDELSKPLR